MIQWLLGVVQGVVSSIIFTWISNRYNERNVEKIKSHDEKFAKDSKTEFYVAFFVTLFLTALPTSQYQFVNDSVRALTFISLGFVLMGFMCVWECVSKTNFTHDEVSKTSADKDSESVTDEIEERVHNYTSHNLIYLYYITGYGDLEQEKRKFPVFGKKNTIRNFTAHAAENKEQKEK